MADPFVGASLADLTDQIGHAEPTPAHTAAALHIAVRAASQAIAAGQGPRGSHDLDRLIIALNTLASQAAQTLQRLAYHADRRELPGLAEAPDDLVAAATDSLAHAGFYSELVAGHLKETHLTLTKHQLAAPTALATPRKETTTTTTSKRWHPPVAITTSRVLAHELRQIERHSGTEFAHPTTIPLARRPTRHATLLLIGTDRSIEAVRCLERRALRNLRASLRPGDTLATAARHRR